MKLLKAPSCSLTCYSTTRPPKSALIAFLRTFDDRDNNGEYSSTLGVPGSLGHSSKLQHLYYRRPQLRKRLRDIHEATNKLLVCKLGDHDDGGDSIRRIEGRGNGCLAGYCTRRNRVKVRASSAEKI